MQPFISSKDLFYFLFDGDVRCKHLAMLYSAYIDDSADRDRKQMVISAAIIGDFHKWSYLDKRWRERLAQDGIEYFKSSQCDGLRGQFFKFNSLEKYPPPKGREAADQVQADLDEIIHDTRLTVIGIIIPMDIHQKMQNDSRFRAVVPSDPYHWAVQTVWSECANVMRLLGRDNIVTFAQDDGSNFHVLHEIFKDYQRKNKKNAKVMADFVPLNDKLHPPVQAADVAATVTLKYAQRWINNPQTTKMQRLKTTMYRIAVWDEECARNALEAILPNATNQPPLSRMQRKDSRG